MAGTIPPRPAARQGRCDIVAAVAGVRQSGTAATTAAMMSTRGAGANMLGPAAMATLRSRERDELAAMVCADAARAVLVHGATGAGRSTLIQAGVVPLLQSHGVVAVACSDPHAPTVALASALVALGLPEQVAENPANYLTRIVSTAVASQQFVFAIDDVDQIFDDERALTELGELYARLVSRAGGRVRFLFGCDSARVHGLAALERRTGSLFPPSATTINSAGCQPPDRPATATSGRRGSTLAPSSASEVASAAAASAPCSGRSSSRALGGNSDPVRRSSAARPCTRALSQPNKKRTRPPARDTSRAYSSPSWAPTSSRACPRSRWPGGQGAGNPPS